MQLNLPLNPVVGQSWLSPDNVLYRWSGRAWETGDPIVFVGARAAAPTVTRTPTITMGPLPPDVIVPGDLWFNTEKGYLYIFYDDGSTTQWIVANPGQGTLEGPPGQTGAPGRDGVMADAPDDGREYIRQDQAWRVLRLAAGRQNYLWSPELVPPPAPGQLRCNVALTELYAHKITGNGIDTSHYFNEVYVTGHKIYIEDMTNPARWIKFNITASTVDSGDYWTVGVAVLEQGTEALTIERVAMLLL